MRAPSVISTTFLLALCGVAAGARSGPVTANSQRAPAIEGLDHIPVAVRDLDRAVRDYRELGFALKPGRPHANGIRNHHVKFPDGTELELITAPEARDALTKKYRRHLADGDGPAFLALFARELDRVAGALDAANVSYRRGSGLVDITDEHVLDYIFFGGHNKSPTDRPEHFAHVNGAEALISVWLAADDLSAERAMLEAMGVRVSSENLQAPDPITTDVAWLPEGEIVFLPGSRQLIPGRRIVGATLRVASVATARKVVGDAAVQSTASSVFLPPQRTHGLWLELREVRADSAGRRSPR